MKNIATTLILFFGLITAGYSQFHFAAGAQLIFDGSTFGVQGKAIYDINDSWGAAGTFTYHLESGIDYTIDFDAHYTALEIGDGFDLTPIAGISILRWGSSGFSDTDTGFNLGAMFTFAASESMNVYAEPKFRIGDWFDGLVISGGIMF